MQRETSEYLDKCESRVHVYFQDNRSVIGQTETSMAQHFRTSEDCWIFVLRVSELQNFRLAGLQARETTKSWSTLSRDLRVDPSQELLLVFGRCNSRTVRISEA